MPVVRLQNLSWSASAPDVRKFFRGLEIPNGGVRIIGGEDGECFVSFTSRRDAHDAMEMDGDRLNNQKIKLYHSSDEEMEYVIALAKGEKPQKPQSMRDREDSRHGRKRQSSPRRYDEPRSKHDRSERAKEVEDPRYPAYSTRKTQVSGNAQDTRHLNENFNNQSTPNYGSMLQHGGNESGFDNQPMHQKREHDRPDTGQAHSQNLDFTSRFPHNDSYEKEEERPARHQNRMRPQSSQDYQQFGENDHRSGGNLNLDSQAGFNVGHTMDYEHGTQSSAIDHSRNHKLRGDSNFTTHGQINASVEEIDRFNDFSRRNMTQPAVGIDQAVHTSSNIGGQNADHSFQELNHASYRPHPRMSSPPEMPLLRFPSVGRQAIEMHNQRPAQPRYPLNNTQIRGAFVGPTHRPPNIHMGSQPGLAQHLGGQNRAPAPIKSSAQNENFSHSHIGHMDTDTRQYRPEDFNNSQSRALSHMGQSAEGFVPPNSNQGRGGYRGGHMGREQDYTHESPKVDNHGEYNRGEGRYSRGTPGRFRGSQSGPPQHTSHQSSIHDTCGRHEPPMHGTMSRGGRGKMVNATHHEHMRSGHEEIRGGDHREHGELANSFDRNNPPPHMRAQVEFGRRDQQEQREITDSIGGNHHSPCDVDHRRQEWQHRNMSKANTDHSPRKDDMNHQRRHSEGRKDFDSTGIGHQSRANHHMNYEAPVEMQPGYLGNEASHHQKLQLDKDGAEPRDRRDRRESESFSDEQFMRRGPSQDYGGNAPDRRGSLTEEKPRLQADKPSNVQRRRESPDSLRHRRSEDAINQSIGSGSHPLKPSASLPLLPTPRSGSPVSLMDVKFGDGSNQSSHNMQGVENRHAESIDRYCGNLFTPNSAQSLVRPGLPNKGSLLTSPPQRPVPGGEQQHVFKTFPPPVRPNTLGVRAGQMINQPRGPPMPFTPRQGSFPPRTPMAQAARGSFPPRAPMQQTGQGSFPPRATMQQAGQGSFPTRTPMPHAGQGSFPPRAPMPHAGQGSFPPRAPMPQAGQGSFPPRASMMQAPTRQEMIGGPNQRMPLMQKQGGGPTAIVPPRPTPIVPVSDPCAVINNLPPTVTYKQLRGLFATHDITPLEMHIKRSESADDPAAAAVILFDNVQVTVLALNELHGMKITGCYITISPCPRGQFDATKDANESKVAQQDTKKPTASVNMTSSKAPSTSERRVDRRSPERPARYRSPDPSHSVRHRDRSPSDKRRSPRPRSSRRPSRRDSRSPPSRTRNRSPVHKQQRTDDRFKSRSPNRDTHSKPKSATSEKKFDMNAPPWATDRFQTKEEHQQRSQSGGSPNPERKTSVPSQARTSSAIKAEENKYKPSWCAVLTCLPPKTSMKQVTDLLTGLDYSSETIYVEYNVHKECTGTAYVELSSEKHRQLLIEKNCRIGNQTVMASAVSKQQMNEYVSEHKKIQSQDNTKPGDFVLQFGGLPMDANPKTISEFLYPTKIKESEVTIIKNLTGRCTGIGFVKVHSLEDRDGALKHDRGYIGKRYVTLRVVSEQSMKDLLARSAKAQNEGNQTYDLSDPDSERTVRMENLRYDMKSSQVEAFFRDYNPEHGSVKFMMHNGMPSGRGSIKLRSGDEAQKAVEHLHKKELAGRPLFLQVLSK